MPEACAHARTECLLEEASSFAFNERTLLLRCLGCGQHLLMEQWQTTDGEEGSDAHHRQTRPIAREQAEARLARARKMP